MLLKLTMIQTLALASVVLLAGNVICQRIGFLHRYNIPAAVVGGFVFAVLVSCLRTTNLASFEFDTTLQSPLMIAFFTTIGWGASFKLMRQGGAQVLIFWLLAALLAVCQSGLGIMLAKLFGVHPFMGLIAGSVGLTGGHATGAAFGALMQDQHGFAGAVPLAMAAATFGLVAGGLLGGPLGTALIRRHQLKAPMKSSIAQATVSQPPQALRETQGTRSINTLRVITLILIIMWIGGMVSGWLNTYFTLPAYIGAMLIAALLRNVMDALKIKFQQNIIDNISALCLSLFLAMALMSLRLWELSDLALPLLLILVAQVIFMALFAYFITIRFMGRDYDAAVMASGQCGFGLGATPTAFANMNALVERYGHAPRAYIVVPMVGSFFIDFTNMLIITTYINMLV
jgi:glutamate:Na+ symporter, ESS family